MKIMIEKSVQNFSDTDDDVTNYIILFENLCEK